MRELCRERRNVSQMSFYFTLYLIIFDFYDILSLNPVFHSEAQYYLSVARLPFLRKASQFPAVKGPTEVSLAVLFEPVRGGGEKHVFVMVALVTLNQSCEAERLQTRTPLVVVHVSSSVTRRR